MILQRTRSGLVAIASAAVATVTAATAAATEAAATTTATATATETTTATTAAPTESTAPTATAPTAFFARAGFVDGQRPAAVLLAVERRDRGLGFVVAAHLHKTETFASAGVAVVDDLGRHDGAVLAEQLLEFRAINAVAQVPNIKLLTHYVSPVNG
jgi:hypothetical protein